MADVYVNALTTISTEPTTTDSIVAVNRNTNEGKIIDYNKLADVILNKLTSKTYSGLNTTSKLLVGAINELDSDVSSLDSSVSDNVPKTCAFRQYELAAGDTVYLNHTSPVLFFTDRGGIWTEGVSLRTLAAHDAPANIAVTRISTRQVEITNNFSYGTTVFALSTLSASMFEFTTSS